MTDASKANASAPSSVPGTHPLPTNKTTIRRTHQALHDFTESLNRDLAEALTGARFRRLGAARHVERVCRYLLECEGGKGKPARVTEAPSGVFVSADLTIGLKYVNWSALAARVESWSGAIAALVVFEGTRFPRKPLRIGPRTGEPIPAERTAERISEDEHLETLRQVANSLLAEFSIATALFERRLVARSSRKRKRAADSSDMLTPPQVAKRLRVSADKVRAWIDKGELTAINVAREGAARPRWLVKEQDLAIFERQRQPVKTAPAPKRSPRRTASPVKEYF